MYNLEEFEGFLLQAGVTVSSRIFKKAVERNRVKRILREAYRLHKLPLQVLLNKEEKSLYLFFIYTGREMPDFEDTYKKVGVIITELMHKIKNQTL